MMDAMTLSDAADDAMTETQTTASSHLGRRAATAPVAPHPAAGHGERREDTRATARRLGAADPITVQLGTLAAAARAASGRLTEGAIGAAESEPALPVTATADGEKLLAPASAGHGA